MTVTIRSIRAEDAAIRKWVSAVRDAARAFEARWTWAALKRVDPDVHGRLVEQRNIFDRVVVTGMAAEVETHGAALCRGYAKAVQALDAAAERDDAYLLGQDPRSGFRVAIGEHKATAERVRELHGQSVVWVTPDEVAALLAGLHGIDQIAEVKRLFAGAEILDVRASERLEE
jgi:hypothetical protein